MSFLITAPTNRKLKTEFKGKKQLKSKPKNNDVLIGI
jgi:hypothetical protein